MIDRLSGTILLLAAVLGGCSTDKKADAAQPPKLREGSVAPRPTVVSQPATKYQPQTVTGGVRLSGTVDFDGPLPADTVIELPPDAPGCGQRITDHRVVHTGTRIGGAIVWINDIRTGKQLPLTRRFELTNEDCMLTPQVQGVVAPATLDVTSNDVALHLNHIVNVGTGELEAIAPFNDNGEVIPFDRLFDKTEQLEISCTHHPWSKAWILVFDHPYFATTEKTGTFAIEDIPPGTYQVKAWHPLLGVAEQTVTIAAGQTPTLSLKLAQAAPPIPSDSTAAKPQAGQ
jgi:hypothetical protein